MNKSFLRKKIISSLCAIGLASILLIVASISYGWFSKNVEVQASSMEVSAVVNPQLVISEDEDILLPNYVLTSGAYSVTYSSDTAKLKPATHDSSSPTFLKYCDSLYDINSITGLANPGSELTFSNCTDDGSFFVDYTVLIASSNLPMENTSLYASIDFVKTLIDGSLVDSTYSTHKAISVDYYLDSVSSDNFKGTLNYAGYDSVSNDLTEKTELELFNGTIPQNIDGYITVVMRIYFDGALIETLSPSVTTFVNRKSIETLALKLGLKFFVK